MHRVFRVRLLYLGWLLVGVAGLALGWYTLGGAESDAAPGRYVEGVVGTPERINPLFTRLNEVDGDLAALLFNGLTRIGGDGTPQPDLAERWDVAVDGLSYVFYLRPDVFWHDGERLDARDIAFTIEQVQAPGFRGPPALAAQWAGVAVTAVDGLTVLVRLPAPSAAFLTRAALGVLPEHLLAGLSDDELFDGPFNRAPVGTGPYRLVQLDGESALLERNPSYHLGAPAVRELELRFFGDRLSVAAAMRAGELHGALFGEAATEAELEALEVRADLTATELLRSGYTVLYLNNQAGALRDHLLRRAIAAAVDAPALLATVAGGRGVSGDGPIVPGSWAYVPGEWPSPEQAGALFNAAGWPQREDGVRARGDEVLELELVADTDPLRRALAEAVAEQLRAQGVAVTVVAVPSSELLTRRLEPRRYELAIFGWKTEIDPDPYGGWHTSQISNPGRNVAGYNDTVADALLEAARVTLDVAERRELYERFNERFVETAPSVVLYYPARAYVHPRALSGLTDGLLFEPASRFRDVHLWRFDQ